MITSDDILVIDKDENPVGLITKLELIIDIEFPTLECKIHQVSEDNPKATHIKNYTVNSIYKDGPTLTIIKLN